MWAIVAVLGVWAIVGVLGVWAIVGVLGQTHGAVIRAAVAIHLAPAVTPAVCSREAVTVAFACTCQLAANISIDKGISLAAVAEESAEDVAPAAAISMISATLGLRALCIRVGRGGRAPAPVYIRQILGVAHAREVGAAVAEARAQRVTPAVGGGGAALVSAGAFAGRGAGCTCRRPVTRRAASGREVARWGASGREVSGWATR